MKRNSPSLRKFFKIKTKIITPKCKDFFKCKDLMLFKSKKYNSDMGQPCLHAPNCRNWDSDDCIEWIVKED